ncbi:MAG: hypothetical protein P8141_05965 [Gammaproteobacteria bacterium]
MAEAPFIAGPQAMISISTVPGSSIPGCVSPAASNWMAAIPSES